MTKDKLKIKVVAPRLDFLLPYIERRLSEAEIIVHGEADHVVYITDNRDGLVEKPAGALGLFCPNIVGTGMAGFPMMMAEAVARGRFYHMPGNEARLSTVHATDVAEAVALAIGCDGDFTVTDLDNPTYDEFAEALACRINNRRIYTLAARWARWVMPRALFKAVFADSVFDGTEFAARFGFRPTPVTEYLKTHIYDDESL